jgi:hypothetical protein
MSDFFHVMKDKQMDKHRAASARCVGAPAHREAGAPTPATT